MRGLYKMREEYKYQSWYSGDGVFQLDFIYQERFISNFGTDCLWKDFRTGETINLWDRCMRMITQEERRELVREYNLHQLGI
jgi:hypothetical protein